MAINVPHIEAIVAALHLAHFGSAADYFAARHYLDLFARLLEEQGDDPAAFPNAAKALSEAMYADRGGDPEPDDTVFVSQLYQTILGRDPDPEGLGYWVGQLASGEASRGELALLISNAAREYERDGDYVEHRSEVAGTFAYWDNSNPSLLAWADYNAVDIMQGVSEDPASMRAALGRLPTATARSGEIFDLTPEPDLIEGTAGDDVINAYWITQEGQVASTLTEGDVIVGGGGRDVLNIYADPSGRFNVDVPPAIAISGVEVVNLYGYVDEVSKLADASLYAGLEALWQIGAASPVTNLGADVVAGFRNLSAGSSVELSVAESTDAVNIVFDNVSGALLQIFIDAQASAAGTFTVNLSGSVRAEDTDDAIWANLWLGDGVDTLVLNTDIDLSLWLNDMGGMPEVIDASRSSGALMYRVDPGVHTVRFGSGDDFIVFSDLRPLTLSDSVDGGGGYNVAAFYQATFDADDYAAMHNLQNINLLAFLENFTEFDAAQLAPYKEIAVIAGSRLVPGIIGAQDPNEKVTHAIVHNLAADQELQIWMLNWYEERAGHVTLVNAADDISIVAVNAVDGPESGAYVIIESKANGAARGTLTLSGDTWLSYDNRDGMFTVIDASGLEGGVDLSYWESVDDVIPETGMSSAVRETVILGAGSDWITLGVSFDEAVPSSSTYFLMDVIENFNSVVDGEQPHDLLLGITHMDLLELPDDITSLTEAFELAAASYQRGGEGEVNVLFFHYDDNTYLYADTLGEGQFDAGDFALMLVGIHDFTQSELYSYQSPYA